VKHSASIRPIRK